MYRLCCVLLLLVAAYAAHAAHAADDSIVVYQYRYYAGASLSLPYDASIASFAPMHMDRFIESLRVRANHTRANRVWLTLYEHTEHRGEFRVFTAAAATRTESLEVPDLRTYGFMRKARSLHVSYDTQRAQPWATVHVFSEAQFAGNACVLTADNHWHLSQHNGCSRVRSLILYPYTRVMLRTCSHRPIHYESAADTLRIDTLPGIDCLEDYMFVTSNPLSSSRV